MLRVSYAAKNALLRRLSSRGAWLHTLCYGQAVVLELDLVLYQHVVFLLIGAGEKLTTVRSEDPCVSPPSPDTGLHPQSRRRGKRSKRREYPHAGAAPRKYSPP